MTSLNTIPKVVDLSHYDEITDIAKVKAAGIIGIIQKASEGPAAVDRTFAPRRPLVLGAGMLFGAYHFLRPGDQRAHAKHFLDVVGDPTGLCLVADWEIPAVSVADLKVWLSTVREKVGRWPVVYSYASMLIEKLGTTHPDPVLAQTQLWLAAYSSNPHWPTQIWPRPWLWQFTGDGNGPGVHQIPGIVLRGSKGIDVDAYEGGSFSHAGDLTDDDLRSEWARDAGAPAAPQTPASKPDLEPVVDKPAAPVAAPKAASAPPQKPPAPKVVELRPAPPKPDRNASET